jgi:hypothetical protein
MTTFALVHSPSVGPATWQPVASRLRENAHRAVVPSLLTVGVGAPPYWPRVVGAVAAGLTGVDPDEPLVLVVHSNAGVFVPVLVAALGRRVSCCIFADATIPATGGSTPMVPPDFVPFLRDLAGSDGRLPRWTDWWDAADTAAMFPDDEVRGIVTAEQPQLPLDYYLESVPALAGWEQSRCGYLMFSAGYQPEADRARARGWPVRELPGQHLHQVVDPDGVSRTLLDLAG